MLFSTLKTKGGLRSDSLGDSSKITPSIWETRWPAAETKKKISDGRRKNKGKGAGERQQQQKTKTQQPANQTIKPNPGDTEAVSPGPSRTAQRPDPLCASVLAHGPQSKQGRRCRWEDWRPFILPSPSCAVAGSDPPAPSRPGGGCEDLRKVGLGGE